MDYSFDSDQTSSTDGPASAALKASRDRKRSRSSSKSPSPRVETHRQTSQIQIDSDSDEVPLSRSPTPPSRSFLPDPNAYRSSASSKSSTSKASLNTPLSVDNLGFAMLMKMGWSGRNQGLGKDGKGRLEPIEMKESGGSEGRGLGKLNQDVSHIIESTASRRELQSEKQSREDEEQRSEREKAVAAKASLRAELDNTLQTFRCQLCEKQYSKTSELDNHFNSYDHHHTKRLKELAEASRAQARARAGPNAAEKRREKERRKEEEVIRRASLAAGVVPQASPVAVAVAGPSSVSSQGGGGFKPIGSGASSGGWKSVGGGSNATSSTTGWKKVEAAPLTPTPLEAPSTRSSLSSFFSKGQTVNLDTSPASGFKSINSNLASTSTSQPASQQNPSRFKPTSSFKSVSFSRFNPVEPPPPPPPDSQPQPPPPPPPPM